MRKPRTKEPIPVGTHLPFGKVYNELAGALTFVPTRLFAPQVFSCAWVAYVPVVLMSIAKSMQLNVDPGSPEQPAVIASLPVTPSKPASVILRDCPTWPAPVAVDCVGGNETAVITCDVQLAQETNWPG